MDMKLPENSRPYLLETRLLSKGNQITIDLSVLVSAFVFAYLLRFDFDIPQHEFFAGLVQLPGVVLIQLVALHLAGVYTFIWCYIGMTEVRSFINAALWSFFPVVALRMFFSPEFEVWRVPYSIII